MDPKRRVCLALTTRFEDIRRQGVLTVTPQFVLSEVMIASEAIYPERCCGQSLIHFLRGCMVDELRALIEEYRKSSELDLMDMALKVLDEKTSTSVEEMK